MAATSAASTRPPSANPAERKMRRNILSFTPWLDAARLWPWQGAPSLRLLRRPGLQERSPQLPVYGIREGRGDPVAPAIRRHLRAIARVGKIAQFNQHCGNIRSFQHDEACRAMRLARQNVRHALQLRDGGLGKANGFVQGIPL